jgi:hypothetical protein
MPSTSDLRGVFQPEDIDSQRVSVKQRTHSFHNPMRAIEYRSLVGLLGCAMQPSLEIRVASGLMPRNRWLFDLRCKRCEPRMAAREIRPESRSPSSAEEST